MSTSKVDATVAGIIALMKKRGLTLATAESITGGALAGRITDTKGASAIFLGSIVSYSDASKTKFLGVAKRVLTKSTAVSEVVARQMAEAARREFGADFAIATTGGGRTWAGIWSKSWNGLYRYRIKKRDNYC